VLSNPELSTGVEHRQACAGVALHRPQMWMTSSGVYRFLGMVMSSLVVVQSNIRSGPD